MKRNAMQPHIAGALMGALALSATTLFAQEATNDEAARAAELARNLANPVAALISVPLQYNYDGGYGLTDDGAVHRLNIQPVIPVSVGADWNLITRTIMPLVDQEDLPVRGQSESGLGDFTCSQFLSPKQPTAGGWLWGAGPVELLPTATDETLGGGKWGLGPTVVILKQMGPWTIGGLANHVWSVAGDDDRADVNATFLQPFASYITKTKTTLGLNTESSYDWEAGQWAVPVNATVAQMLKVGPQIIQLTLGARYWAESPAGGPEGLGFRAAMTFLFPK